jgi:predicted DNA-binding protein with PD1-like motif
MLRLDDGEDVVAQLTEFARRHSVRAAAIVSGIGMFKVATFGYWDGKEYRPHTLEVPHELVALHGSIAEVDGAPSIHLHVALAGPDHRLVGGHLLRGTVGILNEIFIETFNGRRFGRPLDESFGLRRLDLQPEHDA